MSMLPFLKKKNDGGGISTQVKLRKPDVEPQDQDDSEAPLMACAQDLMDAVHAQDAKAVAAAFKAAFDILESQPHEEFEHDDEMSEENE